MYVPAIPFTVSLQITLKQNSYEMINKIPKKLKWLKEILFANAEPVSKMEKTKWAIEPQLYEKGKERNTSTSRC